MPFATTFGFVPRWQRLIYVLPIAFLIAYIGLLPQVVHLMTHAHSDFLAWWSASAIALGGSPADVYDSVRLWAMEKRVAGPTTGYDGFPYPPFYLMLIEPLARLPYVWALALWSALWLTAYVVVIAKIETRGVLAALTFPGAYLSLISGQTGFMTLALVGMGFLCLRSRPIVAGVFLGACAYKPQLAVLIPVFLIVTQRFKVLAASAGSLAALFLLSCAAFGWQIWIAFFHTVQTFRVLVIQQGNPGWERFQSLFGAARSWGIGVGCSYLLHFSVAALAIAVAVVIWRSTNRIELQGTALVAATLLVTPYLLHYDSVLTALPIAWLAKDGLRMRVLRGDVVILCSLWLYPAFAIPLARLGFPLAPVAFGAALFVCARRSFRLTEAPAAQTLISISCRTSDDVEHKQQIPL